MCGITGLWSIAARDVGEPTIRAFTELLAHRGPDGQGVWHDRIARLWLGHRRLAVIDPTTAAAQPMSDSSGRYRIVYNGEIYNYLELRKELQSLGHRFASDSDTEVLLVAYIEWGADALLRLNGMWAFAIWDAHRQTLFCARDRFGVKPFFYSWREGVFAFSSELKAWVALPEFPLDIDPHYIIAGTSAETTHFSILREVRSLSPGHSVEVGPEGRLAVTRWWRTIDHLPDVPQTIEEQAEQYRATFLDACRIRLRSDVEVGVSLSGGLDSSSVLAGVALLQQDAAGKADRVRAFTQGFPGQQNDESQWASRAAESVGSAHQFTSLDVTRMAQFLSDAVYSLESVEFFPLGVWAHYRKIRAAGVVVLLEGHGADEALAGYSSYVNDQRLRQLGRLKLRDWHSNLRLGQALDSLEAQPLLSSAWADLSQIARGLKQVARPVSSRVRTGGIDWSPGPAIISAILERDLELARETTHLTSLNRHLYADFHHMTQPSILRRFDRLSMAHGIEVRSPFLDFRLVTFAFALPDSSKIGNQQTKRVLREAMTGTLEDSVRLRSSKVGFVAPQAEWLSSPEFAPQADRVYDRGFLSWAGEHGEALRPAIRRDVQAGGTAGLSARWRWIAGDIIATEFAARRAITRNQLT